MDKSIIKKSWICVAMMAVILIADQVLKIWVKTHFAIGDEVRLIGDWCRLHFVENEGIAFGLSMGGKVGKLCLTLFRLVASIVIIVILARQIKKDTRYSLLISISLILVGAIGNLVDSCFYGVIFDQSTFDHIATIFPPDGGYAPLLFGRVVDMFYFPIAQWTWPDWIPLLAGKETEFFGAIFNIADSAVCVGVALLIIDQLWLAPAKNDDEIEAKSEEIDTQTVGNTAETA